jgi:hypothetical protein
MDEDDKAAVRFALRGNFAAVNALHRIEDEFDEAFLAFTVELFDKHPDPEAERLLQEAMEPQGRPLLEAVELTGDVQRAALITAAIAGNGEATAAFGRIMNEYANSVAGMRAELDRQTAHAARERELERIAEATRAWR